MHAKTWAVAAALAFASTAVADQGRPRIYFPRHVKRQFGASNKTQEESLLSSAVPSETALSSTVESASGTTQARTDEESTSGSGTLLPTDDESTSDTSIPTTDESTSDASLPTTDQSTSERRSDSSVSQTPSRGLPDIDDILTLSFPSTVQVSTTPRETSATGTTYSDASSGFPEIIVRPTLSEDEEEEEDTTTEATATPTTSDGIVLAPTGLLTPILTKGLSDLVPDLGLGDKTSSEEVVGRESTAKSNPTAPASDSQTTESTDDSLGLFPSPTGTNPTAPSQESDAIPSVTEAKPTGTGLLDPIIDPIQSLVSSAVDAIPIPPPVNMSDPTAPAVTASSSEPALTLLPTIPEPTVPNVPGLTGLPIPDLGNGSDPNTNPGETSPPGYTNPPVPGPTGPTTLPIDTNLTIPAVVDPTASPTAGSPLPTGSVIVPPGNNSTAPTSVVPTDAYSTSSGDGPVETLPPAKNSTIPAPKPTVTPTDNYSQAPPRPIATVTGKEGWLGTQLIADDTTPTTNTDLPAPTQSESLPAGMPNSIDASGEEIEQPDGTTLIRIVFDRRLHYEFVADNFTASQQIFMYMPTVIGHGEDIKEDTIKMMRLSPIETKQKKGWITTAVFAYVPDSIIESLQMDIHLTNSDLYHPPHPIAKGIAAAIDPSYGIFPGSDLEVSESESDDGPGGAPFGGGDSDEQTASQKGTTAGIAVGAVGAAVAYGAAMFLVARRYKRKKQSHRRSSSISGSNGNGPSPTSDMRFTDSGSPATAMMGGALLSRDFSGYGGVAGGSAGGRHSQGSGQSGAGNSGRTAYISAPVAAENSLGWN